MMELTLYIGNKNYSSWSLRPYLALKKAGLPFTEVKIALRQPDTKEKICDVNPAGTLPMLKAGEKVIWDSLAICEYVAELAPDAGLWPSDQATRARARSVVSEMHSSFTALRQFLPMDICSDYRDKPIADEADSDIRRIKEIWRSCLDESGGPFLFGAFTIADAMYAPVVTRFRTYGVSLTDRLSQYCHEIMSLPAMQEWEAEAKTETRLP